MVMRKPRFRSTGTWLEIRSAVQFTVWPKKSKASLLNWSQVLNWSQAQRNLFVFSVSGAGDGNRTHLRRLGRTQQSWWDRDRNYRPNKAIARSARATSK